MSSPRIERIAIVGVGLIGASFGLALRKAGFPGSIVGVSSPRSIAAGTERKAIDSGVTLEEAASSSDLIFLSQPISGIIETLTRLEALLQHLAATVGHDRRHGVGRPERPEQRHREPQSVAGV